MELSDNPSPGPDLKPLEQLARKFMCMVWYSLGNKEPPYFGKQAEAI